MRVKKTDIIKKIVLICVSLTLTTNLVSAGCCTKKVVETGGSGDLRDGTYSLNGTSESLPVYCQDECVYTKDGTSPQDLYCFGPGDIDSTCQAPITDPPAPEGAPEAGGGGRDEAGEGAPPGGYYFNRQPGDISRALLCGETFSVLTEDRLAMLDLSVDQGPADTSMSSVNLKFDRIDGPSAGDVQFDHLLAIMATSSSGAMFRLQINGETKPSSDSTTAKLKVSSCEGNVQYGVEYSLVSAAGDITLALDTGSVEATTWDIAAITTRLHIQPV